MSGSNSNYLGNPVTYSQYPSTTVFGSVSSAPNATTNVFNGFSSINTTMGDSALHDIALIERDLLNAFYTRVGERVMRPDYGCKIWDWLMDPLTPLLYDQIVAEVVRICNLDSRVNILNTDVYEYQNGLQIAMTLNYLPFNVVNTFTATFENRQTTYFSNDGSDT